MAQPSQQKLGALLHAVPSLQACRMQGPWAPSNLKGQCYLSSSGEPGCPSQFLKDGAASKSFGVGCAQWNHHQDRTQAQGHSLDILLSL